MLALAETGDAKTRQENINEVKKKLAWHPKQKQSPKIFALLLLLSAFHLDLDGSKVKTLSYL